MPRSINHKPADFVYAELEKYARVCSYDIAWIQVYDDVKARVINELDEGHQSLDVSRVSALQLILGALDILIKRFRSHGDLRLCESACELFRDVAAILSNVPVSSNESTDTNEPFALSY